MFPKTLDNAKVLFYTPKGKYGKLFDPNGVEIVEFSYLAICKYENDNQYYLFMCNEQYEVETDSIWGSVEECMSIKIAGYKKAEVHWIKFETER